MKKILLFTIAAYFSALGLYAQSFELSHSMGSINNGDTVVLATTNVNNAMAMGMVVKNISNTNKDVKVRRTELSLVAGSENSFCWLLCYPPFTSVSPDPLTIKKGDTTNNFVADYEPHGHAGATYIMYTFFDINNVNDTVAYVAKFIAGSGVGIENSIPNVTVSNIFPNPATNKVSLNFDLNGAQNAKLEIRSIIGSLVKEIEINTANGSIDVDVSDLKNGVYFYSFIVEDRIITSKKLVIQK